MSKILNMPKGDGTRELIEGHPIGVQKIIKGDLRERKWVVDGREYSSSNSDGELLYDLGEKRNRPWFVLVYESGNRYIN